MPGTNGIDIAGGAFFTPAIGIGIAVSHGVSEARPIITATLPAEGVGSLNDDALDLAEHTTMQRCEIAPRGPLPVCLLDTMCV